MTSPEPPDRRWRPTRRTAAWFAGCLLAGLLLSPLVGWLWVSIADPPSVPLATNRGLYLGEQELDQQSGVTLWFLVVGAGFGAVAGLIVGWFGRWLGWPVVLAVLVLCVVGSVGSRYLGVHVFGPDPKEASAHAAVGTLIQIEVGLDTWVAYLGWPIGGLLGVLAAIAGWSRPESPPPDPFIT